MTTQVNSAEQGLQVIEDRRIADTKSGVYEYKFLVPLAISGRVRSILDALYKGTDPFGVGWVHSLYFDSLDRSCLKQCQQGALRKSKVRLRGYDDLGYFRLQLKDKFLSYVMKTDVRLPAIQGQHCAWPEFSEDGENAIKIKSLVRQLGPLTPQVRISYLRHRYRLFDYRITYDEKIRVEASWGLRQKCKSFAALPVNVLEIKTRLERPYLPFLGSLNLVPMSFSKFYMGNCLLIGEPDIINKYI